MFDNSNGQMLDYSNTSLLTQNVVLTSIQRHLDVMNVRWTLKQRCVLTDWITRMLDNLFNLVSFPDPLPNFFFFIHITIWYKRKPITELCLQSIVSQSVKKL